jgi:SAM-dependent methyltransferase
MDFDIAAHFPRSARYDLTWQVQNQMGPNVLWLTESLLEVMSIEPGMRVLDLGCGRALSSIFLGRETGAQIWAADLWIKPTENLGRIRRAGVDDRVFPIHAEAHALPFADGFFDAIVSMDAFHYFGTDVHYLETHLLKHLRPGGRIGIVSPASPSGLPDPVTGIYRDRYYWMNSVAWWRRHWERNAELAVERCEPLPGGWELWKAWQEVCQRETGEPPHIEHTDLVEDGGKHLGFVRMIARRAA